MEIHDGARRITMVQAIAHNLSTIDRDLDMLRKLAHARQDGLLVNFAERVQNLVHVAYADALAEFGIEAASVAMDDNGHVHREPEQNGHERTIESIVASATNAAKKDETR